MDSSNRLLNLLDRFATARIAVLGDLMLDQYLYGDTDRISPEAPVPILRIVRREAALGGAASVAADIAALGAAVETVGVIGQDPAGTSLSDLLKQRRIAADHIVVTPHRPTTLKTRLVGLAQHRHRQQLVRIDEEDSSPVDAAAGQALLAAVQSALTRCSILCIQDYGKGVVTPSLCQQAIALARSRNVRVLVDPMKSRETVHYAGAWLATPNRTETEWVVDRRLDSIAAVREARDAILAGFATEHVCVTLDADGCALLGRDSFDHIPTKPRDVYDVTGAGDEVLAALAVALAAGADLRQAAALANVAGGLEVEKFGCVPVTRDEMIGEILLEHRQRHGKRRELPQLISELSRRRAQGEKVVFTNGCFDVLHRGHVEYLSFARNQGDLLVVAINSDASVRRQRKGAGRPFCPQDDRAAVLESLESVDYVIVFDEDTPVKLLETIAPDVLVKGGDYTAQGVVGREVVERQGGRVVVAPLVEGQSTSTIVERIRSTPS